ncbi:MAG: hypothetical protein JSU86_05750 [Phycisphaerales bacterium]|nr:MAG: hypothetical protein JSU86_05750 [Phycisphaerales bacterium]
MAALTVVIVLLGSVPPPFTEPVYPPTRECAHASHALREAMDRAGNLGSPRAWAQGGQTDVLHYDLSLDIDPDTEWLTGSNLITVRAVTNDVATFYVRLDEILGITDIRVNGMPALWQRLEHPTVEIILDRPYSSGEEFTVAVDYNGSPYGADNRGFKFQTSPARPLPTISSNSQPWLAYRWWPAKDDNRDKTTARLRLTVPDPLVAVSNGLLIEAVPLGDGWTCYIWETNYPTVDSLYCVNATDYNTYVDYWAYNDELMPVELYVWPEDDAPENLEVWAKTADMLDVFSELFGAYPFVTEKYGGAQFAFPGAMEHQTLTSMRGFTEFIFAHELGHQWWGDLVTVETWNHMWLHEGFATYSEVLWEEFKPGAMPDALKTEMWFRHPIDSHGSVYLYNIEDWPDIYAHTVYYKGCWILHMLRGLVGHETFFEILRTFRQRHEFSHVTTDDFIAAAEDVSGMELDWYFNPWIYEEGFPLYRVSSRQEVIGGQQYVELYLEQIQSAEYPTYAMPIQVADYSGDVEVPYIVWNDARAEHLLISTDEPIDDVLLDPDWWVLHLLDGEGVFVEGPPKIITLDPEPHSTKPAGSVSAVTVGFHKEVVADASYFILADDKGHPVPFSYLYDPTARSVTLTLAAPLSEGVYTLTVSDTVVDAPAGLALDGEMEAAMWDPMLPSGDGLPGGKAIVHFTVDTGNNIPTVSEWGMVAMTLLMLSAGTVLLHLMRRQAGRGWPSDSAL